MWLNKTDPMIGDLLDRVENISSIIESGCPRSDQNRNVDGAVYDALKREKLFSMLLPRQLGGLEVHPAVAMMVWEAVAKLDSAAGWNLSQSGGGLLLSAQLQQSGIEKIYGSVAQPVFAGAGFPPGKAVKVDGGYELTGRVPFASGCQHADWLFMPAVLIEGDKPIPVGNSGRPDVRLFFFPRADVEIFDTWHTFGMRGTGSADIAVDGKFVANDLVLDFGDAGAGLSAGPFSGPLYRMGSWPVIIGEAVTALGIAAAAIDDLVQLAGSKTPAMSATMLRDREMIQCNAGKARSLLESARAYLFTVASKAYENAKLGEEPDIDMKISLQLANCHAAQACADAVDLVFESAGSSAFLTSNKFERYFRDIHVITQHATKSVSRYASAGKMMFGLRPDIAYLA